MVPLGGGRSPNWRGQFRDCPCHSKALAVFGAAVAAASLPRSLIKGIIQSQITYHAAEGIIQIQYARQAQIEIRKILSAGGRGLSAGKRVMGVHSAGEV